MTALAVVPLAPLVAAALIAVFGRRLPACGGWIGVLGTLIAAVALLSFHGATGSVGIEWFGVGPWHFTLSLRLDGLGGWLATLVAWVSLAVNVYAVRYAADEDGRARFHAWMAFFVGSMLTLLLAGSLLLLFLAWEGVGLASFALIAQRRREPEARRAALQALLMTRIGDFGLLLGWLLTLHLVGTTDIATLLDAVEAAQLPAWAPFTLAMLFLAAALGKSAQLPFTAWLPQAMVGPTPVSALIHSATMVAAGVYLVLRLFPLFEAAPPALDVVLWVGGVTAVLAALAATAQADLKRVLAWSTVSQLGEMFMAIGAAAPIAATLHLTTHAAFKACLFLGAGIAEKAAGSHELARLGGLYRRLPWTAAAFAVAACALAGVPPFAGYWSEEGILAALEEKQTGWAIVLLGVIALAGVYIARAAIGTFGPWREAERLEGPKPSWLMQLPMLALAGAAATLGVLIGPAARVLPWPESVPASEWGWTAAAIAASVAGLSVGVWRIRRQPVPALGAWASALSQALQTSAVAVAGAVRRAGRICAVLEGRIDGAAVAAVEAMRSTGRTCAAIEDGVDRLARASARATLSLAAVVRHGEDDGFWVGNDRFARALDAAGASTTRLESGKIFLYSAGVFAWALFAAIGVALFAWLT